MTIQLIAVSPFFDEETQLTFNGPQERVLAFLMTSRLHLLDYEVLVEDGEGERVPFEDAHEEDDDGSDEE